MAIGFEGRVWPPIGVLIPDLLRYRLISARPKTTRWRGPTSEIRTGKAGPLHTHYEFVPGIRADEFGPYGAVTLVVDASAALYLLASERGIEPFATFGLAAPALLWSEVTSVLNEMSWRGELSAPLAQAAFDRLLASPIDRHAGHDLYEDAREVARTLG